MDSRRRQNVVCDACRLRRVKCDLYSLIMSDTSSPARLAASSFEVLMKQQPDVACSNCCKTRLRCTKSAIEHAGNAKAGKRIIAARQRYGRSEAVSRGASGLGASDNSNRGSSYDSPPTPGNSALLPINTQRQAFGSQGRGSALQGFIYDRTLAAAVSRQLIEIYFSSIHPFIPLASPEGFYYEWSSAGQRSDRMTPAGEALCAVMEAWGALCADTPAIFVGEDGKKVPRILQGDGTATISRRTRAHWGRSRRSARSALALRAERIIYSHKIIERPTHVGLKALILYVMLINLSDQGAPQQQRFLDSGSILAAIMGQIKPPERTISRNLGHSLAQISHTHPSGSSDRDQLMHFFALVLADSIIAAGGCVEPRIAETQFQGAYDWLIAARNRLPHCLNANLSWTMRVAELGRLIATKLSIPIRKVTFQTVSETVQIGRNFLTEIVRLDQQATPGERLLTVFAMQIAVRNELMSHQARQCDCKLPSLIHGGGNLPEVFKNLIPYNLRVTTIHLALIVRGLISTNLDTLDSANQGTGFCQNDVAKEGPIAISETTRVKNEITDLMLHMCRLDTHIYATLLPLGVLQTASMLARGATTLAMFLVEVPANEQGYPSDTVGGYEWTFKTKQTLLQTCISALHQAGWALGEVSEVIDELEAAMDRNEVPATPVAGPAVNAATAVPLSVVSLETSFGPRDCDSNFHIDPNSHVDPSHHLTLPFQPLSEFNSLPFLADDYGNASTPSGAAASINTFAPLWLDLTADLPDTAFDSSLGRSCVNNDSAEGIHNPAQSAPQASSPCHEEYLTLALQDLQADGQASLPRSVMHDSVRCSDIQDTSRNRQESPTQTIIDTVVNDEQPRSPGIDQSEFEALLRVFELSTGSNPWVQSEKPSVLPSP